MVGTLITNRLIAFLRIGLLPAGSHCYPSFMAIVSITRLRVRSSRYLIPFLFYALRSTRQAKHAQGNIAISLLRDTDRTFWTRTVWTTESAMKDYMLAGAHRQAMRKLLEWCDEASLVHWEQQDDREPGWAESHQRLQSQGRLSKVNHPSPAHKSFLIRPPRTPSRASQA